MRSLVNRVLRLLFVVNAAALWLLLRDGPRASLAYLRGALTLFLWPELRPTSLDPRLPEVQPESLFPNADWTRAEILYPLPRPGGVRTDELVVLSAVVRSLQPRRIVEIGTAEGRTTLNLSRNAPAGAFITTIDLPPGQAPATDRSGRNYQQLGLDAPGGLLTGETGAKIECIRADSTRFDWSPYEGSVDLVYVDGAHDYESVRSDSENALRIVRPGGVIFWHDYDVATAGVMLCLHELARDWPVVWVKGTRLACLQAPANSPAAEAPLIA